MLAVAAGASAGGDRHGQGGAGHDVHHGGPSAPLALDRYLAESLLIATHCLKPPLLLDRRAEPSLVFFFHFSLIL